MKRFLFASTLVITLVIPSAAQITDTARQQELYSYHMKHRATYNKVGWVALTGGLALSSYSILKYVADDFNGPWEKEHLFFVGGVMALSSTLFFIKAGSNRRKARLALKGELISLPGVPATRLYPALSFRTGF